MFSEYSEAIIIISHTRLKRKCVSTFCAPFPRPITRSETTFRNCEIIHTTSNQRCYLSYIENHTRGGDTRLNANFRKKCDKHIKINYKKPQAINYNKIQSMRWTTASIQIPLKPTQRESDGNCGPQRQKQMKVNITIRKT